MYIIGFIATVLSVVGYIMISNLNNSNKTKVLGYYIRVFSASIFIGYTTINKDYNVLLLTVFYGAIDFYNLRCLLKELDSVYTDK